MPLPNKNPKTTISPKKGDKTKPTKPAEKTTPSTTKVDYMYFPTEKDEIFGLLKTDEKKQQFEENFNSHIGFIAGVTNGTTGSIMREGYKTKEQCAKDGIKVKKSDIGKEGRKYTYFRFVFRKQIVTEKDKEKTIDTIDMESMPGALFSSGSSTGAWIFIPKKNIMQYKIYHVKDLDAGGNITKPTLQDFANIYSTPQDNMRGHEISFDKIEVKDIQYFATTHEHENLDKLDELGDYVASYNFSRWDKKREINLVELDQEVFGKGKDRSKFNEKEQYKSKMVHIYKNKTYDDLTKTSTDTEESTDCITKY